MISVIASYSKYNFAIGKNGALPWNLPGERFYFKQVTTGNAVIMGRKTFESLGKILPERLNIVLSENHKFEAENLITAKTFESALEEAEKHGHKNVFIIGGESVYREALKIAEKLYLTEVDFKVQDADSFFPPFDITKFVLESEKREEENGIAYWKRIYKRDCFAAVEPVETTPATATRL